MKECDCTICKEEEKEDEEDEDDFNEVEADEWDDYSNDHASVIDQLLEFSRTVGGHLNKILRHQKSEPDSCDVFDDMSSSCVTRTSLLTDSKRRKSTNVIISNSTIMDVEKRHENMEDNLEKNNLRLSPEGLTKENLRVKVAPSSWQATGRINKNAGLGPLEELFQILTHSSALKLESSGNSIRKHRNLPMPCTVYKMKNIHSARHAIEPCQSRCHCRTDCDTKVDESPCGCGLKDNTMMTLVTSHRATPLDFSDLLDVPMM